MGGVHSSPLPDDLFDSPAIEGASPEYERWLASLSGNISIPGSPGPGGPAGPDAPPPPPPPASIVALFRNMRRPGADALAEHDPSAGDLLLLPGTGAGGPAGVSSAALADTELEAQAALRMLGIDPGHLPPGVLATEALESIQAERAHDAIIHASRVLRFRHGLTDQQIYLLLNTLRMRRQALNLENCVALMRSESGMYDDRGAQMCPVHSVHTRLRRRARRLRQRDRDRAAAAAEAAALRRRRPRRAPCPGCGTCADAPGDPRPAGHPASAGASSGASAHSPFVPLLPELDPAGPAVRDAARVLTTSQRSASWSQVNSPQIASRFDSSASVSASSSAEFVLNEDSPVPAHGVLLVSPGWRDSLDADIEDCLSSSSSASASGAASEGPLRAGSDLDEADSDLDEADSHPDEADSHLDRAKSPLDEAGPRCSGGPRPLLLDPSYQDGCPSDCPSDRHFSPGPGLAIAGSSSEDSPLVVGVSDSECICGQLAGLSCAEQFLHSDPGSSDGEASAPAAHALAGEDLGHGPALAAGGLPGLFRPYQQHAAHPDWMVLRQLLARAPTPMLADLNCLGVPHFALRAAVLLANDQDFPDRVVLDAVRLLIARCQEGLASVDAPGLGIRFLALCRQAFRDLAQRMDQEAWAAAALEAGPGPLPADTPTAPMAALVADLERQGRLGAGRPGVDVDPVFVDPEDRLAPPAPGNRFLHIFQRAVLRTYFHLPLDPAWLGPSLPEHGARLLKTAVFAGAPVLTAADYHRPLIMVDPRRPVRSTMHTVNALSSEDLRFRFLVGYEDSSRPAGSSSRPQTVDLGGVTRGYLSDVARDLLGLVPHLTAAEVWQSDPLADSSLAQRLYSTVSRRLQETVAPGGEPGSATSSPGPSPGLAGALAPDIAEEIAEFERLHSEFRSHLWTAYGLGFNSGTATDIFPSVTAVGEGFGPASARLFSFIGRLVGVCLLHPGKFLFPLPLSLSLFKLLLDQPLNAWDLKHHVDRSLFNSLEYLTDVDEAMLSSLVLSFSNTLPPFPSPAGPRGPVGPGLGATSFTTFNLAPDGSNIDVNNDNLFAFFTFHISGRLGEFSLPAIEAFVKGVAMVVPLSLLRCFSARELQTLTCGLHTVDPEQLLALLDIQQPLNCPFAATGCPPAPKDATMEHSPPDSPDGPDSPEGDLDCLEAGPLGRQVALPVGLRPAALPGIITRNAFGRGPAGGLGLGSGGMAARRLSVAVPAVCHCQRRLAAWFRWCLSPPQMGPEDLGRFLAFATGTPRMPVGGRLATNHSGRLTVRPILSAGYLPTAHTCSGDLDIPVFPSREAMLQGLLRSMETTGFQLT
ncbi:hypothetical protein H696_04253 [Fonticula alba]|uniref:HECT-type E3 ubiquitin transferase n=1 Tax=Fonticula alba TaxID=691883 RepID=A0A058Z3J1_FONAL|nr:hypothetical protein H696_04253 [Fonticula alba]KCV68835.1 hypothetical protein H696_04253 [Fonticula alba]|eukprot:XP_009496406.1 hypothetical protein H696_04253 [Fonticula alba]